MKTRDEKAKAIFLQGIELGSESERASFLDAQCDDDMELRRDVEELLRHYQHVGSFLESRPGGSPTIDRSYHESLGTSIGPYKLLQEVGEGGMGVVYKAEQKEPVKRRVALKIIKPGMDTRQVIARFEAERQALAMMDHPNIAKVFDAGQTEMARPYFVMELVNGISVTQYCDEQHLSTRERLDLFVPICQAVQHAHQKGIIHRDLKPSNILVALYDGIPVPKIIDFGVAKATSQSLTDKTMFTQLGQIVGTLEYMSPEQAQRNQLDIDTRSDIYSLGVVLYELLTGDTPHDRQRLRSVAFDEMLRIIREEEPPKPSIKLSSSATLPSVAANRHADPQKLTSLVRGELDWIVMKALEKDRSRRYETVSKFAEDIRHYLNDEPVVACPPSRAYRVRKFARRNKALLFGVALISAILISATAISVWQAVQATKARNRAQLAETEADANFLTAMDAVTQLLDEVGRDELTDSAQVQPLRESLLQKALGFYQLLAEQTRSDADLARFYSASAQLGIGEVQFELGKYAEANKASRNAISELQSLVADSSVEDTRFTQSLADAYRLSGLLSVAEGKQDVAERSFQASLRVLEDNALRDEQELETRLSIAEILTQLGNLYKKQGAFEKAEEALVKAIELAKGLVADSDKEPKYRYALAKKLGDLSNLFDATDRPDEAKAASRKAIEIVRSLNQESPTNRDYRRTLAMLFRNYGISLLNSGKSEAALEQLESSVGHMEELVENFPSISRYRAELAGTLNAVAITLAGLQQTDSAIARYRQSQQSYEKLTEDFPTIPAYKNQYGAVTSNLGLLLAEQGNYEEAYRCYEKAINQQRQAIKLESGNNARYREFLFNHIYNVALADAQQGKLQACIETMEEMIREFKTRPEFDDKIVQGFQDFGGVFEENGDTEAAEELIKKAETFKKR